MCFCRYVSNSGSAAPLTLSMLQEMLSSPKTACRSRAFDLILNLGVHAQLLEPIITDNTSTIEEEYSQESYFDTEAKLATQGKLKTDSVKMGTSSAIHNFESWILNILYEILLLLVQIEEKEESVWASALSCLLYFVCDRGKILRNRLNGLDVRCKRAAPIYKELKLGSQEASGRQGCQVIKALLEISRKNSWAEVVHCKLISMLANMFYEVPKGPAMAASPPLFVVEQIDLIGGIEFIFLEYTLANSRDERRSLYLVLFDYVLHQVNETCMSTGGTEYSEDDIQPLAALLSLTDAPEAFYISVKLGVEGIGEILRRSISATLSRYPNNDRLNMITKSYQLLQSVEGAVLRNGTNMIAKLSWATLHSLLHSERTSYRQHGYVWLGDLLIAEISEERNAIWPNIKNLQQNIAKAGGHDSSVASNVPLCIWLMCGLLKSKHSFIRWGFLFVLERLLMRCKFLIDENEMQHSNNSDIGRVHRDSPLEKANAVIDVMSSALTLVFQINETDHINILKMCDIVFSQLCLRVPPATALSFGDDMHHAKAFGGMDESKKFDINDCVSPSENASPDVCIDADSRSIHSNKNLLDYESASMAALLLQGQAVIPMQLVSRVPAALFYWPLIQLAGAATDNIALGIAVGSKGRGNLPGATSDIRSALLLLLIGKCTADSAAFQDVGGEEFFRELLDDTDSRVAYYSSAFLLKARRMMTEKPEKYQQMLQNLVVRAQQSNNEKLLENPYLQMRGILQLANDLGTGLTCEIEDQFALACGFLHRFFWKMATTLTSASKFPSLLLYIY
ncbi:Armadillo-type fold containing protein, partial [Parasponia andersonii]